MNADDYILEEGQHEDIVSEELWNKVCAKRIATGIKQLSKAGKDRTHLLTGILKCPKCGCSMYINKHEEDIATTKLLLGKQTLNFLSSRR